MIVKCKGCNTRIGIIDDEYENYVIVEHQGYCEECYKILFFNYKIIDR